MLALPLEKMRSVAFHKCAVALGIVLVPYACAIRYAPYRVRPHRALSVVHQVTDVVAGGRGSVDNVVVPETDAGALPEHARVGNRPVKGVVVAFPRPMSA